MRPTKQDLITAITDEISRSEVACAAATKRLEVWRAHLAAVEDFKPGDLCEIIDDGEDQHVTYRSWIGKKVILKAWYQEDIDDATIKKKFEYGGAEYFPYWKCTDSSNGLTIVDVSGQEGGISQRVLRKIT
jgi:hypothetical protein